MGSGIGQGRIALTLSFLVKNVHRNLGYSHVATGSNE
jgi:hypothetical protein